MAEKKTTAVATATQGISEQVLARVNQLSEVGFTMPADYNHVNAIKMSMLKLQEIKDKDGHPALDVCTPNSIASALFKMCTKGLNAALNQCYLIVRGDQLCCDDSYFGKVLQVKRIFPDWEPCPQVIHEGDKFDFSIDTKTGHRRLIEHKQTLESMDKDFIGGYIILPTKEGDGDLYIMTKKQIIAAWEKSSSVKRAVHAQFTTKMIGKTLVNSGCNMIINSTPSANIDEIDHDDPNAPLQSVESEYEEVVDTDTGEVKVLDAPGNTSGEAPTDSAPSQVNEAPSSTSANDDDF